MQGQQNIKTFSKWVWKQIAYQYAWYWRVELGHLDDAFPTFRLTSQLQSLGRINLTYNRRNIQLSEQRAVTHPRLLTKLNFTYDNTFCWPCCWNVVPEDGPLRAETFRSDIIVFIKLCFNNIYVISSVFIWNSEVIAGIWTISNKNCVCVSFIMRFLVYNCKIFWSIIYPLWGPKNATCKYYSFVYLLHNCMFRLSFTAIII